jgi:hypothetical protein
MAFSPLLAAAIVLRRCPLFLPPGPGARPPAIRAAGELTEPVWAGARRIRGGAPPGQP